MRYFRLEKVGYANARSCAKGTQWLHENEGWLHAIFLSSVCERVTPVTNDTMIQL